MKIKFSYLDRQFADFDDYLDDLRLLVESGDFTLGAPLDEFENRFAELCRMPYAIGVGSGTDALILSLKALGVGPGDEVITTPNTFIATVGAIAMTGARPVFVDSNPGLTIDATRIEAAVTTRTKAILPVHYSGNVADMPVIMDIARRHGLTVVEDACQAITAARDGNYVGSWGQTACFSLHPLKNLNVWGDGGVIVTRSGELNDKLRLLRNHGLTDRDRAAVFGHNSRLDSLQAVIGNRLINQAESITERRIANARHLDEGFADLADFIRVPPRQSNVRHVYHIYIVRAKRRDELLKFLGEREIEAKIHYPVPVHLQPAAQYLGYQEGDFPTAESDSRTMITLPAHQHLEDEEIDYVTESVRDFYGKN
jgi:dTDP-4-amino-4,6-dideoxygalactose transaminase